MVNIPPINDDDDAHKMRCATVLSLSHNHALSTSTLSSEYVEPRTCFKHDDNRLKGPLVDLISIACGVQRFSWSCSFALVLLNEQGETAQPTAATLAAHERLKSLGKCHFPKSEEENTNRKSGTLIKTPVDTVATDSTVQLPATILAVIYTSNDLYQQLRSPP